MVLGIWARRDARYGTTAGSGVGTRHQQEGGEPAVLYGTERKIGRTDEPRIEHHPIEALLIDGVHFAEHVVLVAVAIDGRGAKRMLGLREGATKNASAVRALLADLVERGWDLNRSLIIVIDGAKALHKAVVEVLGP